MEYVQVLIASMAAVPTMTRVNKNTSRMIGDGGEYLSFPFFFFGSLVQTPVDVGEKRIRRHI
jgi:hypothetical protein